MSVRVMARSIVPTQIEPRDAPYARANANLVVVTAGTDGSDPFLSWTRVRLCYDRGHMGHTLRNTIAQLSRSLRL